MDIGTIIGESDLPDPLGSHLKDHLHMLEDMAWQYCQCSIEDNMLREQLMQPTHISVLRLESPNH